MYDFVCIQLRPTSVFCTSHNGRHGLALSRTKAFFCCSQLTPTKELMSSQRSLLTTQTSTWIAKFWTVTFAGTLTLFSVMEIRKPVLSIACVLPSKTGPGLNSLFWLTYSQTFWGSLSSLDQPSVSMPLLYATFKTPYSCSKLWFDLLPSMIV